MWTRRGTSSLGDLVHHSDRGRAVSWPSLYSDPCSTRPGRRPRWDRRATATTTPWPSDQCLLQGRVHRAARGPGVTMAPSRSPPPSWGRVPQQAAPHGWPSWSHDAGRVPGRRLGGQLLPPRGSNCPAGSSGRSPESPGGGQQQALPLRRSADHRAVALFTTSPPSRRLHLDDANRCRVNQKRRSVHLPDSPWNLWTLLRLDMEEQWQRPRSNPRSTRPSAGTRPRSSSGPCAWSKSCGGRTRPTTAVIARVARQLDVGTESLRSWVKQARGRRAAPARG